MAPLKSDRRAVKSYSEKIFEKRQTQVDAPILLGLTTSFPKDFLANYPPIRHRGQHKASVARFLNWFAYSRKYCLDSESLKHCPLVDCSGKFHSEREMMNHLYNCTQLQNGSYQCSNCKKEVKIRRFHGNTCPETHSCKERIVSAISPLTRLLSPRPSKRQQTEKNTWIEIGAQHVPPPFSPQSPQMQLGMEQKWYSGDDLSFMRPELATERVERLGERVRLFEPHDIAGPSELASKQLLELGDTSSPSELYGTSMDREKSRLFELHGTPFELTHDHSNHQTKPHHSEPIYMSLYPQVSSGLSPSPVMDQRSDEPILDVQKTTVGRTFIGHRSPHESTNAQFTCKTYESIGALSPRMPSHGRSESASSTESYFSSGTMTTGSSDMSSSIATTPSSIRPEHVSMMSFHHAGVSFDEDTSALPLNSWLNVEPSDDSWGLSMSVSQASIYEQGGFVQMTPVCASDLPALSKTVSPKQLNLSFENEEAYGHFPQLFNRPIRSIPILMEVEKNALRPIKPENPYTCVCGSEFRGKKPNKKSNLQRHQDTCPAILNNLPAPKKFKCSFPGCEKRYTRSDNLLVHKRAKNHMSEVIYDVIDDLVDSSFDDMEFNDSNVTFFNNAPDVSLNKVDRSDKSFEANCDKRGD